MPDDLAEVYRTTYHALVRFLYRKVWDAERAADLAQEAFARALVHRPANARGWLFVVAANLARDEGRRRLRERRHLTLLKAEPETTGEHGEPEEAIDLETRRARVRAALEELPRRPMWRRVRWPIAWAASVTLAVGLGWMLRGRENRALVASAERDTLPQMVAMDQSREEPRPAPLVRAPASRTVAPRQEAQG